MTLDLTAPICCAIIGFTAYRIVLVWGEVRVRTKSEPEKPQVPPPVMRVGSLWALLALSISAAGFAGYELGRRRSPAPELVEEGPGRCTPRTCKPPKKCVENVCTDTADQARGPSSELDHSLASLPDEHADNPVDPPDGLN